MGGEGRLNWKDGNTHRKKGMRQVSSTPSRNLRPAMIKLGHKIGSEYCDVPRRERISRAIPAMIVGSGVLPADGHPSLVWGSIIGTDWKLYNFDCGISVLLLEKLAYKAHEFADVEVALS